MRVKTYHLCRNCIKELKENWPYIDNKIQVVIVEKDLCDNFSDEAGISNTEKQEHKTITLVNWRNKNDSRTTH